MKFEEEYFSKEDLLDRGWSNSMINTFYGDPEFVIGKGSKKKMFKFFNKNKVFKIEKANNCAIALEKRHQQRIESKKRRLNEEVNAAFDWCFNLKIDMVSEEIDFVVEFASYHYNQKMYQKTGVLKPGPEEDWADSLNFGELVGITQNCIKHEMSNFGEAFDYIKNLKDEAISYGCEFKSYTKCLWILNIHFTKTFEVVYPNFESDCLKIMADRSPVERYCVKILPNDDKVMVN